MKVKEKVKCLKCGFENFPGAKYCSNCGEKLAAPVSVKALEGLEDLFTLHLVGSLYVLTSLVFNAVVRASLFLAIPYLASGVLGLVSAWTLHSLSSGKSHRWRRWVKLASAMSIALGLAGTLTLFLIGLGLRGIVGPAWLIFVINAWKLWKNRSKL
jgi:uncharacterized protein (DUF983 family)